MKRNLALVLTSLLLVFSLTACGKDQQPNDAVGNGGVTDNNGTANGGDLAGNGGVTDNNGGSGVSGGSSANSGGATAGGTVTNGVENAMDNVGDAARDVGDAITGRAANHANSRTGGYTYDQMVQNGRVF